MEVTDERPTFKPTKRPPQRDQFQMKLAVVFRDGLDGGCHWCRKPFGSMDDVSLEHIIPLADGGPHELSNCALACYDCNNANVPKSVLAAQKAAADAKADRKIRNILAQEEAPQRALDAKLETHFEYLDSRQRGEPMSTATAKSFLRSYHSRFGKTLLAGDAKIFAASFNTWQTLKHGRPLVISNPHETDGETFKRFDSVRHDQRGESLDYHRAAELLRAFWRQRGAHGGPSKRDINVFKGHFNRWNEAAKRAQKGQTWSDSEA